MKLTSLFFLLVFSRSLAQYQIPSGSIFSGLKENDSVTVYQCHVEKAVQELKTSSGQTITGTPQEMSITDKFVIRKKGGHWEFTHYSSTLNVLPNRKFSGLKLREKPYWNFTAGPTKSIGESEIKWLCALEAESRETLEYDFTISKYTRNQVIFKKGKKFRQLLPPVKTVIKQMPGFN